MPIELGGVVWHGFMGDTDLVVMRKCRRGDQEGFFCTRKRLVDVEACSIHPQAGWEVDRWFEWRSQGHDIDKIEMDEDIGESDDSQA